jgi:hypothetical protein
MTQNLLTPQLFAGLRDTWPESSGRAPRARRAGCGLDADLEQAPSALRTALALLESAAGQAAIAASLPAGTDEVQGWAGHAEAELRGAAGGIAVPRAVAALAGPGCSDAFAGRPSSPKSETESSNHPAPLAPSSTKLSNSTGHPPCVREVQTLVRSTRPCRKLARTHPCRPAELRGLARSREAMPASDCSHWKPWPAMRRTGRDGFHLLFDPPRDLFSIGFNVTERPVTTSFYDLLASEARLCSYVAIAWGRFRRTTGSPGPAARRFARRPDPGVVERLDVRIPDAAAGHANYENTLLDHTCQAAVQEQIAYGKLRGVPWGISESGYNRTDAHLNYQYRAFGVPGLGLKRGWPRTW